MARYKIAPTKTNLIKTKQELEFAREGYELLEQKREILVAELLRLMDRAQSAQDEAELLLKEAFYALEQAVIRMGRNAVEHASLSVNIDCAISLSKRGIMGVEVPVVKTDYKDEPPYYSLSKTSFWLDESIERFRTVMKMMGRLAETRISLIRLAHEVNKVTRRVNALEKIYIPDYEETLRYIEDSLEEHDRESFFVLKLLKSRLQNNKEEEKVH